MNSTPTDAPMVSVLGASSAGVLYDLVNREYTVEPTSWFKPAGGTPQRLEPRGTALVGTMLFSRLWGHDAISYRTLPAGLPLQCAVPDGDAVAYIGGGWIQGVSSTKDYLLVTAGPTGCSSRRLTTINDSRLVAADETGFAVEVTTWLGNGGVHDLLYVPYDDPADPVQADTGEWVYNFVSMSGGTIAWARRQDDRPGSGSEVRRWSRTSGADPATVVGYDVDSTAVIAGATAFAGCPDSSSPMRTCVGGSIPAGSGPVSIVVGATQVADDDRSLYLSRFGPGTGIDRGVSFADPASLTRVVPIPLVPPGTWAIALGASRAAYIDTDGADDPGAGGQQSLHWRYAAKSGSGISLLTPIRAGDKVATTSIDGRRQLIGRTGLPGAGSLVLRTEGEPDAVVFRDIVGQYVYGGGQTEMSGTRALWIRGDYSGNAGYSNRSAMLYDVRTRTSTRLGEANTTKWALWGSYVVWATKDGSIYRRELSSNKTVTVKSKGYGIVGLGVWGSYVGWSECVAACYKGNVAYRNMSTGAAAVRVAAPGPVPLAVRVTGGHVVYAYGDLPGNGAPHLRELRLGTKVTAPIADARWWDGSATFDAHDEVLAWIGLDDQQARIAPNSAFVDPPKYLGNALVTGSFALGGTWSVEFPVSKALPTCELVVRSKLTGTVLRRLPCGASTGSARTTWDGRLADGRQVPRGSYSWTLTGSDADGALRWWTGNTAPIAGSVRIV